MQFLSTRGTERVSLEAALTAGLAPDGGLYVPESLPRYSPRDFAEKEEISEIAERFLAPFFAESRLGPELGAICRETFTFPVPLVALQEEGGELGVLELFHGPTSAFKDIGARFLAASLDRLQPPGEPRPLTILVATSGDTGGAVAAAFHRRPGFRVVVLYPEGQVSPRQAHQLECWGGNVLTLRVQGVFDDCQRLVKAAFADAELARAHRLSSANSINIGRLLPQAAYYAAASLWHWRRRGRAPSFVIPTGNLGNAHACVLAREMGLPIGSIVLATNANRTIPGFLASGRYEPRASIATLASAMDVGDPSNMERLRHRFQDIDVLRREVSAQAVDDEEIREQIRRDYRRRGRIWCPHTAVAACVYDRLAPALRREQDWTLVATAHPAKFETVVEPLIGTAVEVPAALQALLERPAQGRRMSPDGPALREELENFQEDKEEK